MFAKNRKEPMATQTTDPTIRPAQIPEELRDLLDKKGFAHLATLRPDGSPQSTPMWYGFDGGTLLFSTTTGRQKYRNVTANPQVAVSILDPEDPYRYLEIRGVVTQIDDDEGNAFINSMAKKYRDLDVYPWDGPGDHRVVMRVTPVRTYPPATR